MNKYLLVLLIALCSSFRIMPDVETDKLVMKAAEGQLPVFLARIKQGNEAEYGFRNEDDMEQCTIGQPYRELGFSEDFYNKDLEEDKDYIVIRNEWHVPVMIQDKNRVLLTVKGTSGNYMVTSMGEVEVAKELQQRNKFADETENYYILRIPKLGADFFVHETNNSFTEAEFIALTSARNAIPSIIKGSYTLSEVQQMAKKALLAGPKPEAKPMKKIKPKNTVVPVTKSTKAN
jgi:hypothetical protein